MVTQKKVSGHADESTMARMTVTRKTMISMIKLQTTRVVRLPLRKARKGRISVSCRPASQPNSSYPRFTKMFIQLKRTLGICEAKPM